MEQISAFRTTDGNIFASQEEASRHEKVLYETKIFNLKESYVREKLIDSCYGHLFIDKYSARKHTNVSPDNPLIHVLMGYQD